MNWTNLRSDGFQQTTLNSVHENRRCCAAALLLAIAGTAKSV
jgi:hypothetical protein